MRYPESLYPVTDELFRSVSGDVVRIPKASPVFRKWRGDPPKETYGNKPILDINGVPGFAELATLKLLQADGWLGVWIDTFRKQTRSVTGARVDLPSDQRELLEKIYAVAGTRAGYFDIFCWMAESVLFVEAKQKGRDRVRPTQVRWLTAALETGLPVRSFLIVEWQVND